MAKRRDYRPRSLRNLMPDLFGEAPVPDDGTRRTAAGPQR